MNLQGAGEVSRPHDVDRNSAERETCDAGTDLDTESEAPGYRREI